jgi:hypothetical protein
VKSYTFLYYPETKTIYDINSGNWDCDCVDDEVIKNIIHFDYAIHKEPFEDGVISVQNTETFEIQKFYLLDGELVSYEEFRKYELILELSGI